VINGVHRHRGFVAMKTVRKTAKLNLRYYTGVPKKKRKRVHSSLIYRRIYTPSRMVVNGLQGGILNSRIAPRV
jgi:hypothetical protein